MITLTGGRFQDLGLREGYDVVFQLDVRLTVIFFLHIQNLSEYDCLSEKSLRRIYLRNLTVLTMLFDMTIP